ncbi:MAG: menaquinone biosynthesis protein [Pirellulales bacterium]|nr:menaquinone biosynthesis protein [Pirellulales bacterium]
MRKPILDPTEGLSNARGGPAETRRGQRGSETSSRGPLRVGAVNYLNTKPLVYGLGARLSHGELSFDYPSRLADSLRNRELEIALVPSIELALHPEWSIVSDACIGSLGPVLSVKLMFRVPPPDVRLLALDEASRTSAVLAQILLSELCDVRPQLTPLPLGCDPKEVAADAVLVIGDRAICSDQGGFVEEWDLGDRWSRWADLPFVFAMWVARSGVETQSVAGAFAAARDSGCQNLEIIAREQAAAMQLPQQLVEDYLCRNLYYRLGPQQRRGLELYYAKATELGLIQSTVQVKLDDCPV